MLRDGSDDLPLEPDRNFEILTCGVQIRRSATELIRHIKGLSGFFKSQTGKASTTFRPAGLDALPRLNTFAVPSADIHTAGHCFPSSDLAVGSHTILVRYRSKR